MASTTRRLVALATVTARTNPRPDPTPTQPLPAVRPGQEPSRVLRAAYYAVTGALAAAVLAVVAVALGAPILVGITAVATLAGAYLNLPAPFILIGLGLTVGTALVLAATGPRR
jgi:hypothetical protein